MLGTVGYLYAVAGVIGVLNESGTMEKIIEKLVNSKLNKTVVGSEIIMGIGIMLTSICLGSANGPAIIMFGPIADDWKVQGTSSIQKSKFVGWFCKYAAGYYSGNKLLYLYCSIMCGKCSGRI